MQERGIPKLNQQQISQFIADKTNAIDTQTKNTRDVQFFRENIPSAIAKEKFGRAIELLMELMDFKQNIYWHIVSNPLTQKEMLIRDARHCTNPVATCKEPYLIMTVNYLRATKALLPINKFDEIRPYLAFLIRNFYLKALKSDFDTSVNDFACYNTVLLNLIAYNLNITFKEAQERLNIAKDFVNLEEPARDIVTIYNLKDANNNDATVFQAEFPISYLTEELKNEYKQYKIKKWFQIIPDWQQALVENSISFILSEKRILPTQLRIIPLPGLRNQYETINGILRQDKLPIITFHAFHSGTIVALGQNSDENVRITLLNAQQLKNITHAKHLLTLTLNSNANPTGNDQDIVKTTGFAADSLGLYHANLPLNFVRRISRNKIEGINSILLIVCNSIIPVLENYINEFEQEKEEHPLKLITDYLKNEEITLFYEEYYYNQLKQILSSLCKDLSQKVDESFKSTIEQLCDILDLSLQIYFLSHKKNVIDPDNRNLTLGCLINILVYRLESYLEIAINSSCESGKDRAAILMFKTTFLSFNKVLFNSYSFFQDNEQEYQLIKNNITIMAAIRHFQFLAGCQGGTYGAFGIKKDSEGALPVNEFPSEARSFLIQKTASFNKRIPILDNQDTVFFPMGSTNPLVQRMAITQVLLLQDKKLNSNIVENGTVTTSKRISLLLKSDVITKKRSYLLANTIAQLNELPNTCTLQDILKIIQLAAVAQKKLTQGTAHGIGTTTLLLQDIEKNLQEIITEYSKANLAAPHQTEQKRNGSMLSQ